MWTQERKGALSRELLFDPLGSTERRALSVTRLLQLHMGMFMFLCEVGCDTHRPPPWRTLDSVCTEHSHTFLLCRNVLTVSHALSANAAKRTWLSAQTSPPDIPSTITSVSSRSFFTFQLSSLSLSVSDPDKQFVLA